MDLTAKVSHPNPSVNLPRSAARNEKESPSLPNEILAEIFSMGDLTIRTDPDAVHESEVFTLMQVCRRWRCIAVSTPVLWSSLLVDHETLEGIYDDSFERNQVFEAFTEMCLTRSAGRPLDMVIAYLPSIQDFPWLIATSNRWRSLEIDALDLHTMTTCVSFPGLPALRSLVVHSVMDNFPDRGPNLNIPRLASLELPSGSGCLRRFNFSIATLTTVEVQVLWSTELPSLAKHLSLIRNITQLHLSTRRPYTYHIMRSPLDLPNGTLFRLPNLQRLFLESTPSGAWGILYHSHLPSLVQLSVRECVGRNTPPPPEITFRRFLDSFPGQLQSFSGQDMDFARFKAVVLQLKPRAIKFGHSFIGLDQSTTALVRDVITDEMEVAHIEHISLFDAAFSPASMCAMINSLGDIEMAEADYHSHSSPLRPRKRIDLYVNAPMRADTHRDLQDLLNGLSSRSQNTLHRARVSPDWMADEFV